ncbi:MAG TPA: HAD hydrolase-like protein [Candidatus Ligilactobacillus excrementavium]|nr:HAD hydrolase-like protein [Candidatus Ligilactobacillus excrementavium]
MNRNVFFDFDGTLADTAPGIVNSLEYTSEKLGLPQLGENEYATMIGPAFRQGFARLYPNIDQQTLTQAEQLFFQHYFDYGLTQVAFYPHIFETLSRLQQTGYSLHIVSGEPENIIQRLWDNFDLGKYFTGHFGSVNGEVVRVDKPDILKYAVRQANAYEAQNIMVGDRYTDIVGGIQNQMDTIGVTYGFGDKKELQDAQATALVSEPTELTRSVLQISAKYE